MNRRVRKIDGPLLETLVEERLRVSTELEVLQLYEADLDESIANTLAESKLSNVQQLSLLTGFVEKAWSRLLPGLPPGLVLSDRPLVELVGSLVRGE